MNHMRNYVFHRSVVRVWITCAATILIINLFTTGMFAQQWRKILSPDRAMDWSDAGVGQIPARTKLCANLTADATVDVINRALASCKEGETVYLASGTYQISGTIHIPSNVTLRGAGADRTILNTTGQGEAAIQMGSGGPSWRPQLNPLIGGSEAGSTEIQLESTADIVKGEYLAVGERNNPDYVTSDGSEGRCVWCDAGWSATGDYARGQVVKVIGIQGDRVSIIPGLYGGYTNHPVVVPFRAAAIESGVEDLQVYANDTGYGTAFGMYACEYCWIKGVEDNYTDGDHVQIYWGFHDEVRDSYFSNAYRHGPGQHDSDIVLAEKTSCSLVENNIIERTHVSIMLEWGAAGNVIAYNFTTGEFDAGANNVVIGGIDYHGAHPQYNLLEGNVVTALYFDSIHGSSSDTTAFRNWVIGTNHICAPLQGRGPVQCLGPNGHYGFQAARAIQVSYLSSHNNFVANVVGSYQMQSLVKLYSPHNTLNQVTSVIYPSERSYDDTAYGWTFGYGEAGDGGVVHPCKLSNILCHSPGDSKSNYLAGNYNNIDRSISWANGKKIVVPPSFCLSEKPRWWGSLPFPATGPDVTGGSGPGGHTYGNPARRCYLRSMHGKDGGEGSPLNFNRKRCYGGYE